MLKFTIPRITDSLNVSLREHWTAKRRKRQIFELEVLAAKMNGKFPDATVKQKVIITSYRKRRMDYDNLVGSHKQILDCLTRNKLLVDDSPEWVEVDYRQGIDSKNLRTEIEIKDFALPGHNGLQVQENRREL